MPDAPPILCFNGGSSSLKFALYRLGDGREESLVEGSVDRIGLDGGRLRMKDGSGKGLRDAAGEFADHRSAAKAVNEALETSGSPKPAAIGHRFVHGGPKRLAPAIIDHPLLGELRRLVPFAPLHLPSEIAILEAALEHYPGIPQVACFDTSFHRRMPEIAERLPLLDECFQQGIRKYGFHGLSYEFILEHLGAAAMGKTIIAHLGNGASLCAVLDGAPIDTTMGLTPTGGLMMGTRTGDLDPGVVLRLARDRRANVDEVEHLINNESGLLGVSGISPDLRTLEDRRATDPRANLAIEMFCYLLRKQIGAMVAALDGLDTLVFTGGIGEHSASVRRETCARLSYLGIVLDPALNDRAAEVIGASNSRVVVRVVLTDESLMMARHVARLVFPN